MQFCDFSSLTANDSSIKEEIARLVEQKYIPKESSELIRVKEVSRFVTTDFFQTILKAKKLYREFRFNVFLPAADFTDNVDLKVELSKNEILVQGVVDLCYIDEEGRLILCDYKTDRIPKDIMHDRDSVTTYMKDRHIHQLKYYAMAIERIMGRKPDKTYIYSLCYGDALEIQI
jgi:ATP-dependent helicase/nuclease subunit A